MIKRCKRDKNGRFAKHQWGEWGEWNKVSTMTESCRCLRCRQKATRSVLQGLLSMVYLPTLMRTAFQANSLCDTADAMMGKRRK